MQQTFLSTLLIIVLNWKLSKYPSTGECINKLSYINVMGHYLTIKRKKTDKCNMNEPQKILHLVGESWPKLINVVWFHLYEISIKL